MKVRLSRLQCEKGTGCFFGEKGTGYFFQGLSLLVLLLGKIGTVPLLQKSSLSPFLQKSSLSPFFKAFYFFLGLLLGGVFFGLAFFPYFFINFSVSLLASLSVYCRGGVFMKYDEGSSRAPERPLSRASLQHLIASMTTPAEFGESSTDNLQSRNIGTSPK